MASKTLNGVLVKYEENNGKVYWMSEWSKCFELAQAGLLKRVFHPGHGDPYAQYEEYFITT